MRKTIIALLAILSLILNMVAINAELNDATVLSVSLVNQDPDPAIAGDIADIRIAVENLGGEDAENLIIEFVPEYPFQPVQEEDAAQKVGTIMGYQGYYDKRNVKIIKYRIRIDKEAYAGSYELKIKYYQDGSNNTAQKSLSIDVKNRESAEVIHIDKTVLVPGKQSGLRFSINNVGNAPLRDLTFNWENEDKIILPVGSDNTRYVKYIDIGESAEIEYQVIADTNAAAGLYKLNLYLNYESANSTGKKMSTMAGVYVGGGTDFEVTYSESANGQASFSVSNIGSNPANSVSVSIPDQRGWRLTGSNSIMIGNLNKGDYTVASFKLQPSVSAPEGMNMQQRQTNRTQGSLLMQIAYTDTMGERKTVDKEVKLSLQNIAPTTMAAQGHRMAQNENQISKYKWYLAAMPVLALGFLAYRRYRGKKHIPLKDILKRKNGL
ncbi:hypothetical protein HYU11_06570 [Candidatus Woesearchaeota archaeon]|nr:hypothetical protein [Candidatus Woesearchaeota archaeon]